MVNQAEVAKVIKDYSTKSLKSLFNTHIKNDPSILADGWSGYTPLKETYPNLKQTLSNKGRNFKILECCAIYQSVTINEVRLNAT